MYNRFYIGLFILALGFLAALYAVLRQHDQAVSLSYIAPAAGPEDMVLEVDHGFTLTDQEGRTVTEADYKDNYKLLFFGFTNCPDICPAGVQKIGRTLELLGDQGDKVVPLFVTVDPARDTPEVMKEYVALYDTRIVGLTGSEGEIQKLTGAYKAYASKNVDEGAHHGGGHDHHYMVDHSAYIYLLSPKGDVIDLFGSEDSAADISKTLGRFLPES